MIKHIVMIRVRGKSPEEKRSNAILLKDAIDGLMGKIPELKSMETGLNVNEKPMAYDLVLTSVFDSLETLEAYRVHPEHKKVLDILAELKEQTAVVDYDF
jgi:hypothetical protein